MNVAIFPELALDQRLLETLRTELNKTDDLASDLDWVIVGSYSRSESGDVFPVHNSAYILDSAGSEVTFFAPNGTMRPWIQHKRHSYTLTRGEQNDYQLAHLFSARGEHDRDEAISIGNDILVFDGRLGRYAVMICEDWAREENTCEDLRKMNCRVVFVIVMDGAVVEERWAAQKARFFRDETGAHIVVANSLILPRRHKTRPVTDDPAAVGLLLPARGRTVPLKAALEPSADDSSLISSAGLVPLVGRK